MTGTGLDLDERYGRTPRVRSRQRRLVIAAAAAVALVMALWVVFVAFSGDDTRLEATDTGHSIIDDDTVEIAWTLTAPPGSDVSCALQALNDVYGIVGWRVVELPRSDSTVRALTERVDTAEPPVNGLIYRCWLS